MQLLKHCNKIILTIIIFIIICGIGYQTTFILFSSKIKQKTIREFVTLSINRVYLRTGEREKSYNWTPHNEINPECINAIILGEDSTFYEHSGVNYAAIKDAFFYNLRRKRSARGGSTISQQVAKNLFLDRQKTFIRKLKEYFITKVLEDRLNKNQIIEIYLNIAEFGPNIFGIENAANHFFKKHPSNVNAVECAFLSLMLPSPKRNYQIIYQEQYIDDTNTNRIQRILKEMKTRHRLSEEKYHEYNKYSFFKDTN